jgi:hypothetical protein
VDHSLVGAVATAEYRRNNRAAEEGCNRVLDGSYVMGPIQKSRLYSGPGPLFRPRSAKWLEQNIFSNKF